MLTTSENFLGSCDTRTVSGSSMGQCRDWIGTSTANLKVSCDGLNGTFRPAEKCPMDGRVGLCAVGPKLELTADYGYYATRYTEAAAQADCSGLNGVFSTGSGGAAGSGGSGNGGASGSAGEPSCPPECLRAYTCVKACGDAPTNNGCCPCPPGTIDSITCGGT